MVPRVCVDWQQEEQWYERPCGLVQSGTWNSRMKKILKQAPFKQKEAEWHLGTHLGTAGKREGSL